MKIDQPSRLLRHASTLVDRTVEDARASGKLDRRDFLRFGALSLGSALLAACDSHGPKFAQRWLKTAEKQNERVEQWLFSHKRMNRGSPGARIAGNKFPSYFVSDSTPVWDDAARGAWTLEIGGAVRNPVKLTLDALQRLPRSRQRVDHYCVEGWNAVAVFTGVRMTDIAKVVEPTSDAGFVDFASFDDDYHESWDIDSALHPQTMVVYAKEDALLPPAYGAPARIHSPVKLGYKNTKYLTQIMFMPERNGGYWTDRGYEWYGGT